MQEKVATIGIRRENKNKWERRVALIPADCKKLADKGIKIHLQPSALRCFTEKQYDLGTENVKFEENIEDADVIVGVKEIPIDLLIPNKTFLLFSHTLKGQSHNMPTLKAFLDKKIRMIDYELIKDLHPTNSQRLVAFGRFAGIVGTIDFLQGFGEFLQHRRIFTPFCHMGYSYMFPCVDDAKVNVRRVGEMIRVKKLPQSVLPLIIGVTGNGKVSKGSMEILELFPHEYVDANDIKKLFEMDVKEHIGKVYITVIEACHMYRHRETNQFDKKDFYANPGKYKSIFAETFVPYLSVLIHAMYWNENSDRIITKEEAKSLSEQGKFRIMGITDITCDIGGSISLMKRLTTIGEPFYLIDPATEEIECDFENINEKSVLYHAVDHLPAEFPIDASCHFSKNLINYMEKLVHSKYPVDFEDQGDIPEEIKNATMTCNGKLTPKYTYLYKDLAKQFPEYEQFVTK